MLFVSLVLSAAASLRCASQSMGIVFNSLGRMMFPIPRWNTGRLWLLRLGLYKLIRIKPQADDWVWIIDHSIQIGVEKCLVILGLRLSQLQGMARGLRHQDLEPIEILPVKKSNGEIVFEQLQRAAEKTGVPREIISDYGTDLKKGIEQFCQQHSETCYVYDVKHKTAVILKHEFEHDETWNEFNRLACQTRKKVLQTPLAYLAPLNPRVKSRYMNMEHLVRWGERISALLINPGMGTERDGPKVMEQFGWIKGFQSTIEQWSGILKLMTITEEFIRTHGFYRGCREALEKRLPLSHSERAEKIRKQILEFVNHESSKAHPGECLLGSSEVIESVFGKLKRMEQNQSTSGFTGLVLSVGAMVSTTTKEVMQRALETVPTKKVHSWCRETLGQSLQSNRNKFMRRNLDLEQNWNQSAVAA